MPANTFTSTYENYRIVINFTNSNNAAILQSRLRAAGSDNTTSNYANIVQGLDTGNATQNFLSGGQTLFSLIYMNSVQANFVTIDVASPEETKHTFITGLGIGQNQPGGAFTGYRINNVMNATTSFDSQSFIASAGTLTGSYKVYGWNE